MTMVRKTDFFSESKASALFGSSTLGMISISNPDRIADKVKEENWGALLRLQFHDIPRAWQNYVLFTDEQADEIIDFLDVNADICKFIYVHCAQGVSRSAAVSRFIAERFGIPFDYWKARLYNPHVYETLVKRYHVRTGILLEDRFEEEILKATGGKFGAGINPGVKPKFT